MADETPDRPRCDAGTPPVAPEQKDRDEPGPNDRERLDREERETFEDEAMRERDA